jgi:hypothetical protein
MRKKHERSCFFLLALALALPARAEEQLDPYSAPTQATPAAPPTPTGNDFRLKVLFKLDVNYQFDDASTSGAQQLALKKPTLPGGDAQAAALATRADYLSSDHVLGTEGLGWSHLRLYYNGFLLHRFEDGASVVFPTAYLKGDQKTAYDVRSGYAEIDGFKDQGFWSKVYLRAGRQFRYGAGIATFDGLTVGYQSSSVEVSLWGGRRSPRFLDDTNPGFVAGADATLHLDGLTRVPVDIAADYLTYINPNLTAHHLLLVSGKWRMRTGGKLLVSVSSYDFGGMRGYLGLTHPLGRVAQLKVYYDLKIGRDMTYDYISGYGMSAARYFQLPDTQDRSRIGVRFDHEIGRRFEYDVQGTFNVVHGGYTNDPGAAARGGWTGPTAFDATYEELSVTARVLGPRGFTPEAEYRIRFSQRKTESGLFSDTSQAGEHQFQEVRGDIRLRPYTGLSFQVGAVYRVYDYTTRYAPSGQELTVENDTTLAGELTAEIWIKRYALLRVRYEVGTDSAAFAPELDLIQTLYATVGGKF